jgi:hypothetical protein
MVSTRRCFGACPFAGFVRSYIGLGAWPFAGFAWSCIGFGAWALAGFAWSCIGFGAWPFAGFAGSHIGFVGHTNVGAHGARDRLHSLSNNPSGEPVIVPHERRLFQPMSLMPLMQHPHMHPQRGIDLVAVDGFHAQ